MRTNTVNKNNNAVPACSLCKGNCWGCLWADTCPTWLDTGNGYVAIDKDTHEIVGVEQ